MSDQGIAPMPRNCVKDGAPIVKKDRYYKCSKCGASYGSIKSVGKDALKPVPQEIQEPKNPYPDTQFYAHSNVMYRTWQEGHDACAAAYRPLLEQANRKIKALEVQLQSCVESSMIKNQKLESFEAENARLKEELKDAKDIFTNMRKALTEESNQLMRDLGQRTFERDTLKSQLQAFEAKNMVELDENQELPEEDMDIHIWRDYTPDMAYEKCREDMLKAGFRKVKALASTEKGGRK